MLLTGIFCILFAILLLINPFYASYSLNSFIGVACLIFGLLMVYSSESYVIFICKNQSTYFSFTFQKVGRKRCVRSTDCSCFQFSISICFPIAIIQVLSILCIQQVGYIPEGQEDDPGKYTVSAEVSSEIAPGNTLTTQSVMIAAANSPPVRT
jgi:hypothetical protein